MLLVRACPPHSGGGSEQAERVMIHLGAILTSTTAGGTDDYRSCSLVNSRSITCEVKLVSPLKIHSHSLLSRANSITNGASFVVTTYIFISDGFNSTRLNFPSFPSRFSIVARLHSLRNVCPDAKLQTGHGYERQRHPRRT